MLEPGLGSASASPNPGPLPPLLLLLGELPGYPHPTQSWPGPHSWESICTPARDGDKGRWASVGIRVVMVKEQHVTGPKCESDPGSLCLISPFHTP